MGTAAQPDIETALEDMLNRETIELVQFIALLEEEIDALAAGTPDAIRDCAQRKQTLLSRIFATRDSVNALARRAANQPKLVAAEAWLARTSSSRIRQAFNQLTEKAEEARQLNQLASRLIHLKLRAVTQGLDSLCQPSLVNAIYHPEGFAHTSISPKGVIGTA